MQREHFLPRIKEVVAWYGRKAMTEQQYNMWFDQFRSVSAEPFHWVTDLWMRTQRNMPTPQDLRDLLPDYWRTHPKKRSREDRKRTPCNECESSGYLDIWYSTGKDIWGNTLWYNKALPCAKCDNWRRAGIFPGDIRRFWTREEIEAKGWQLENPRIKELGKMQAVHSLEDALAMATKNIPF